MKVPISWLRDYVTLDLPLLELAHHLTLAGLEVEEVRYVGLPLPDEAEGGRVETAVSGLGWDAEKIVVGEIRQVDPHPNADRLVLCRLYDGQTEHNVLTGAPNLLPLKGKTLSKPIKVAYAKQGATLFDGHQSGWQLMTLKPMKIRGVESSSMVCSEKELGISEEHEGIIMLDDEAVTGTPLVAYMGDAVFDIAITPNMARNASILGVAREAAALLNLPLLEPDGTLDWHGPAIKDRLGLEIRDPDLNPRFVLGLLEGIEVAPSPYWVQRRLRLAGVRPINNVVDATNYVMLELGQPLHAFDYDILVERAGGKSPTIITRTAGQGEALTTLDEVERKLDDFTVLVTDTAGPLSIGGVIGGAESEVHASTRNVLLEGAAWEFINIRQTLSAQNVTTEAGYRFSRGVHPAMAERGVRIGLKRMHAWAGGEIAEGLIDAYPKPPEPAVVTFGTRQVQRWLGLELGGEQVQELLERLDFEVELKGDQVTVTAPDHRLDIGIGVVGMADVMEEIARLYGYDQLPPRLLAEEIPTQPPERALEREEQLRDILVSLGLQEVVTYRLTNPEREARLLPHGVPLDNRPYVTLANPISSERTSMRHSLLASVLEVVESNARVRQRVALFELGPVYLLEQGEELPSEQPRLVIVMHGARFLPAWSGNPDRPLDFYDLKGVIQTLIDGLHLGALDLRPVEAASYHPGKTAEIWLDEQQLGMLGELHPQVASHYGLGPSPVVAADLELRPVIDRMHGRFTVDPVPVYPPVLEDLAVVVDQATPAAEVEAVIRRAAGDLLAELNLFDLYEGDQLGEGRKSLAYSLVYQAADRTLTDREVAEVRQRIVTALDEALGAELRA